MVKIKEKDELLAGVEVTIPAREGCPHAGLINCSYRQAKEYGVVKVDQASFLWVLFMSSGTLHTELSRF